MEAGGKFHALLTSALDVGEWSASSHSGRFISGKDHPYHCIKEYISKPRSRS
jgi:hypothetical protein